jgi:alpha-L-fucosidase
MKKALLIGLSVLGLLAGSCTREADEVSVGEPAKDRAEAPTVDMKKRAQELKDLKFGMFICWSFATFKDVEYPKGVKDLAVFNPSGMDTDQWARVAKEAGMGYILFLTKHHPGFCLWDTKTTDWKVTDSPLGKDVLAAVRKSCDKYGLKLALYFSEGDETQLDYRNAELKKAQLRELCTQYGPIEFFWMDHAQSDGGLSHIETVKWVKQFQPACFVGFNHGEVAGDIRLAEMARPGRLDDPEAGGPFNKAVSGQFLLGEFTFPILGPILGEDRWFYTNPENDNVCRSAEEIYQTYLGAVKYGNIFSLDVGPDRTGRLREIDVRTLQQVGRMIRSASPKGQS